MKLNRQNQKGFTIIEVMIVLVIAAIILLIVFLAVPALQRNSRNTQRKNDVANTIAAVNEFASNNQGRLPTAAQFDADIKPNLNLGFYEQSEVKFNPATAGENDISIGVTITCNGNNVVTGGSARQFAAVFFVEQSSGDNLQQCQEG